MENQAEKPASNQGNSVLNRLVKWFGVFLLICYALLVFVGFFALLQFPFLVFFGWIWFLYDSLTHLSPDYSTVLIGIIALALFTFCLNYLIRSLLIKTGNDTRMNWSLRSSFLATMLICVGFVVGTAMIGVTHQATWLATSKDPILQNSFDPVRYRISSKNNLKQIGLALHNYHDQYSSFPLGQIDNSEGKVLHGWLTSLLPFVEHQELYEQIDLNTPWDDQVNRKVFEQRIEVYNNPAIREEEQLIDSATGLPVAHYAGNVRVIKRNIGVKIREITDGTTRTILAGEINSQFQPWGKPSHLRDPALGINKHSYGFGSPFRYAGGGGGAQFLMVDESVRFLNGDIDPKILKSLSTPDGGEEIIEEF